MFHHLFSLSAVRKTAFACFTLSVAGSLQATPLFTPNTELDYNPVSFTLLTVTSGLSITAISPATLIGNVATFPITSFNTSEVDHSGGLRFSKLLKADNSIKNFVLDLNTLIISGTETNGSTTTNGVKFFDLSPIPNSSAYNVNVDAQLSTILNTAFGITSFLGLNLGTASVNETPEPTSLALIGSGLVFAAVLTRRRRIRS